MYNKLYLFCIGGTGSRVLNSLTMLLASGVQLNAKTVVPVVIDSKRGKVVYHRRKQQDKHPHRLAPRVKHQRKAYQHTVSVFCLFSEKIHCQA